LEIVTKYVIFKIIGPQAKFNGALLVYE